jgi:hypothetical protein
MSGFDGEIETALIFHPLCEQIILFLIEHEDAMDTIQGVADCWVDNDEVAVKSALECLVSAGVIVSQAFSSGIYYSLTPNREIRSWLRVNQSRLFERQHALRGSGDGISTC